MEGAEFVNQVLIPAGGVSVVIAGLAAVLGRIWVGRTLGRERAELDVKLKTIQAELDSTNKRLQTELDKSLHIHRVQFEKEFKIYEEVWEKLIELQSAALSLRPELDFVDPKEKEEERKAKRLQRFGDAIKQFLDTTRKSRPFYSEDVYQCLDQLLKSTHTEAIEYKHFKGTEEHYWDKAQKNREEILSQIETCCGKIRERVGSVKVTN